MLPQNPRVYSAVKQAQQVTTQNRATKLTRPNSTNNTELTTSITTDRNQNQDIKIYEAPHSPTIYHVITTAFTPPSRGILDFVHNSQIFSTSSIETWHI